mgnify:CR=1 FL=1
MSDRIKGSALTMGGAACWGVSGCMGSTCSPRGDGFDLARAHPAVSGGADPVRILFLIKDRKTLF